MLGLFFPRSSFYFKDDANVYSSWGFLALTPVYTAELAPAESRGLFVGLNGILIGLGYGLSPS